MGDRTRTEIIISLKNYNDLMIFYKDEEELKEEMDIDDISDHEDGGVSFTQWECNYATWDKLENLLKQKLIPFDKNWDSGGDYEGGRFYCRYEEGEEMSFSIYNDTTALAEFLKELMPHINDPKKIKRMILKEKKNRLPFDPDDLNTPNSVKFIESIK
jgi:hypothetical protein